MAAMMKMAARQMATVGLETEKQKWKNQQKTGELNFV
jgi:hypothetical protein